MSKMAPALAESAAASALEKSAEDGTDSEMVFNGNLGQEFADLKQKVEDLAKGVGFDPDADFTGANTEGTSTKPKASTFA
jgi:hypothetical protein